VRLLDVAPDGTALNLMSPGLDVLRASYRDVTRGRQWLEPGEVYELKLSNLITSNVFLKGHRMRVQVFGSFAPNFSRNLQTGKSEAVSSEMKKARIRLYYGGGQASEIVLPVVK
jgi:predicted acyl esterase